MERQEGKIGDDEFIQEVERTQQMGEGRVKLSTRKSEDYLQSRSKEREKERKRERI